MAASFSVIPGRSRSERTRNPDAGVGLVAGFRVPAFGRPRNDRVLHSAATVRGVVSSRGCVCGLAGLQAPAAAQQAWAIRKTTGSANDRLAICMASGTPLLDKPVGTEMHGVPVTLNTNRACWS